MMDKIRTNVDFGVFRFSLKHLECLGDRARIRTWDPQLRRLSIGKNTSSISPIIEPSYNDFNTLSHSLVAIAGRTKSPKVIVSWTKSGHSHLHGLSTSHFQHLNSEVADSRLLNSNSFSSKNATGSPGEGTWQGTRGAG